MAEDILNRGRSLVVDSMLLSTAAAAYRKLQQEEQDEGARPRKKRRTAAPTKAKRLLASEYVGVRKDRRKWLAYIHHEGEFQHLGSFVDEREAARAFDAAARRLRGDRAHGGRSAAAGTRGPVWRLNFPTAAEEAALAEDPAEVAAKASEALVAQRRAARQPSSRFPGVSWDKQHRKWKAEIQHKGKKQHLDYFVKEEDAAAAAKAAREAAPLRKTSSAHRGVTWNKAEGKWQATITIGGKRRYLGRFVDEEEAAAAYRRAAAERDA